MGRKIVGKTLRLLREKRGWNQRHFARLVGTTQQNVQYYETHDTKALLLDIAELFGIDPFILSDNPTKKEGGQK